MAKAKLIEDKKCSCCEGFFRLKDLDEHGRCKPCVDNGLMPGGEMEQDVIRSEKEKRQDLKDLLRELLTEISQEKKAENTEKKERQFKPKNCEECGKEFTPRYPTQKICDGCQVLAKSK